MEYKISEELLRAILTFLSNQKYGEVSNLITNIQNGVTLISKPEIQEDEPSSIESAQPEETEETGVQEAEE